MDGVVAYILGKSYTKKSLIGIGALAGAPCQVQSINKVDKTTTITLKWEDNVGGIHTQAFNIEDGEDGVSVTNATIDANGHLILTLSDGNDIDCGQVLPQYDTMPVPSTTNEGQILQYIGNTTSNYTNGYYYKCVNDGGVYKWVNIKVQDGEEIFRYSILPTADNSNVGNIVQYIGTTTTNYTNGYYYQCKFDGTNYRWVQKDVQPSGGTSGNSVVNGYYNPTDHKFYEELAYINEIIGEVDKIYISDDTNVQYRWDGTQFVTISSSVEIDDALSTTSENPVQNKVITLALDALQGSLANKVDKETGKGLSTNDFTDELKQKVINLEPIYLIGSGLNLDSSTGRLTATGMSIPIDDHLDTSSINPVQNKVIALELDALQGSILTKIQKKLAAQENDFVVFTNDGDIQDSGISKNIVPSTASVNNKLLVASDLSTKADKVIGATNDDIALLDATGNLKDSNKKLSDYQEKLTQGNGININSNTISLDVSYLTASRVGYIPTSEKGAHSGVAELDASGKVPSSQLPSYVDDIIDGYYKEADGKFYEDSSYTTEIVGESGKIYISVDTDIQYRWTGSAYAALGGALQLGETASTAYRGDRGKTAYDHSQITNGSNPHNTTADNINLKVPITALSGSKLDVESTLYGINTELGKKVDKVNSATNGNLAGLNASGNLTDSGILASNVVVKSNTVGLIKNDGSIDETSYATTSALNNKADKVANATSGNFAGLDANGNLTDSGKKASDFATDNQTFSQASTRANIVSGESFSTIFGKIMKWFADLKDLAFINKPSSDQTTTFLRGDGTWVAPTGTTYGVVDKTANGLAPQLPNETTTTKFLRQDGSWEVPNYPTVNDGTLTIQKNGVTDATFTANQSTNTTVNIVTENSWTTAQTLQASDTSKGFTGLSSSYAYEVWFDCANGVAPPTLSSFIFTSSTTATATFSAVTSAQTGTSGNECKIRLRVLSLS